MSNSTAEKKPYTPRQINFAIGFAASLAYAIFCWGIDAILLTRANVSLPFVKFLNGLAPTIVIILLAVWICSRFNHMITRALVWIAAGSVLCILLPWLSFQIPAQSAKLAFPAIAELIDYSTPQGINARLFVILVMTNILFIVGGLFFESAKDAILSARGTIGWLAPVLLCLAFFAGAGDVADSNFNQPLRDQLISVNEQIEQAADQNAEELSEYEQRLMRRITKLDVDLKGSRRLLMAKFDDSFTEVQVLAGFEGQWAQCLVLNGIISNCELLVK